MTNDSEQYRSDLVKVRQLKASPKVTGAGREMVEMAAARPGTSFACSEAVSRAGVKPTQGALHFRYLIEEEKRIGFYIAGWSAEKNNGGRCYVMSEYQARLWKEA
jgi:hypothetical protein